MTHFVKLTSILAFSFVLSACTADTVEPTFQIESPTEPSQQAQLAVALPRLLNVCPGLNRYAEDLSPAKVAKTIVRGYGGGIEIAFKVAAQPTSLPDPLKTYSKSNNCFIAIKQDGSTAYIAKRACHSICDGTWHENDSNSFGREIQLSTNVSSKGTLPVAAKLKIINSQLDSKAIIAGLSLSAPSKDKSDNGRIRQRWTIRDTDQLEIVGDNQNDADVIAWKCGEYDNSDNLVSPVPLQSFCGKLFIAILNNITSNSDDIANKLLLETSQTQTDASWTSEDISIETDGYFYIIRRTSRM